MKKKIHIGYRYNIQDHGRIIQGTVVDITPEGLYRVAWSDGTLTEEETCDKMEEKHGRCI